MDKIPDTIKWKKLEPPSDVVVQGLKCLKGEHEEESRVTVQTGSPLNRIAEGLTPYGPTVEIAKCKFCKCLFPID